MEWLSYLWKNYGGFWRCLALAAIVFEAGITGTWLSEQMRQPLPYWWGYFGAIIQGIATFGGVNLAQQGRRIGWVVVLISGGAGMIFSYVYFGSEHSFLVAAALGVYPTAVGVVGGIVESAQMEVQDKKDIAREEREFKRLRLLEQDKLKAEVAIEQVRAKETPVLTDGHARTMTVSQRTRTDKADFARWLTANPSATGADIAAAFGVDERTGRRWLEKARVE